MNKIISMILLCALLLSCFAGCATPNAPVDENLPGDEENSTPNDITDEKLPDNEIAPTPDDSVDEKDPGNEIAPMPDDSVDEKDPDDEIDPTPDDTDEKDPDDEIDPTPDDTDEKGPDSEFELPHHFHNENGPTNNNAGNSIDEAALKAIFEQLRADADANAKLEFWVAYEQEYYELKDSDEYANCDWKESLFTVSVSCCYDCAAQYEDWYQQCSATDVRSLNEAFFRQYGVDILNGQHVNASWSTGMDLLYSSPDDFSSDYDAIKALLELGYVKLIDIGYNYGLPICYFME